MKVLVVAAHPDDELLGCAGTLARHARAGDEVHVLIMAQGATSRDDQRHADKRGEQIKALRSSAEKAAAHLGLASPRFAGFADNRMDGCDLLDVVKQVETVVAEVGPAVIYTHSLSDLNVDHRVTHQAVMTACRPLPGSPVRTILAFETPSSTEWSLENVFRPNHFIDISTFLTLKLEALSFYEQEMREFPHARSLRNIEALSIHRGASVGLEAAEAFEVVREVVND